jgi:hypothetical protein
MVDQRMDRLSRAKLHVLDLSRGVQVAAKADEQARKED